MSEQAQQFQYPPGESASAIFAWARSLVQQLNLFANSIKSGPMPGTIQATAAVKLPDGWVACEGQLFSKADAPVLYRAIGDRYNTGEEGPDHFRLPDARDRVPRHSEAAYGGEQSHTLTKAHLPEYDLPITDPGHIHEFSPAAHTHGVTDPSHTHAASGVALVSGGQVNVGGGAQPAIVGSGGPVLMQHAATGVTINPALADGAVENHVSNLTVHSDGGGQEFSLVPAFFGVRWIIKT